MVCATVLQATALTAAPVSVTRGRRKNSATRDTAHRVRPCHSVVK